MTRPGRSLAAAMLAPLLVAATLAGCSLKHVGAPATGVPHTIIFVQGPLDTVNHIVHLYWFGTESNGYISGYEIRMLNPADTVATDTLWGFTTRTDSVFTIRTPNGFISTVFEARAIDEHGMRDPNPAVQRFNFSNQPPIVKLVGKPNHGDLSDTTFASVTVTWTATDIDGDAGKVRPLIWLDGRSQSPDFIAPGMSSYTVPSNRFLVNGAYTTGPRTLYIQGIDDGGMAGPIDSVTWFVKRPVTGARARLLLVDEVPTSYGGKIRVDTLYTNAVKNAGLTPDTWTWLHLQFSQPFRSAQDMAQTFQLFETVIWYHGEQSALSPAMTNYGDGIGTYLDHGGNLMIESLNLITNNTGASAGSLPLDFATTYMNCDGLYQYPLPPDSSAVWSYGGVQPIQSPLLGDSLENGRLPVGMRGFVARDPSQMLLVAPPGTLSPSNAVAMPMAMAVRQPSGGMLIANTYPMVSATLPTTTLPQQRSSIVLLKMYGLLGLTGP